MIVRDGTELRSRGITTMEDANRFLKEVYLPDHNARFVKVPEDEASAFVPFTGNARDTLCVQEDRVVGNDNTVRYKGLVLQIAANRHRHHFVKAKVRVHDYPDGDRDALAATNRRIAHQAGGEQTESRVTRFDVARTQQPKSTVAYGSLRFGLLRYQLKRTIGMVHKPDNSECF